MVANQAERSVLVTEKFGDGKGLYMALFLWVIFSLGRFGALGGALGGTSRMVSLGCQPQLLVSDFGGEDGLRRKVNLRFGQE